MNWLKKLQKRKMRAVLAVKITEEALSSCPWITIGASRGMYLVDDNDVFCRWCGNNVQEAHSDDCFWVKSCEEWEPRDIDFWYWWDEYQRGQG